MLNRLTENIPTKTLRTIPVMLPLFYWFAIENNSLLPQSVQLGILFLLLPISIITVRAVLKRDYEAGKKREVKQRMRRLFFFLGLSLLVFTGFLLF